MVRIVCVLRVKANGAVATEQPMQTLQLNTRLSNKSWFGDDWDEEDPFAEVRSPHCAEIQG